MANLTEYPCVEIDGILHITIDGNQCACGRSYSFATIPEPDRTLVIKSPLFWRTLPEVECALCREAIANR